MAARSAAQARTDAGNSNYRKVEALQGLIQGLVSQRETLFGDEFPSLDGQLNECLSALNEALNQSSADDWFCEIFEWEEKHYIGLAETFEKRAKAEAISALDELVESILAAAEVVNEKIAARKLEQGR